MAMQTSERHRGTWPAAGLLAACALLAYANALPHPFLIDDKYVIAGDPRVHTLDTRAILTQEYWPGGGGNRVYRPLTGFTLALNWAISPQPWTFRLVNVWLHAAGACGLFLLVRELTGRGSMALAAAALFVLHPVHTTPLNQIVDRADIAAAAGVFWVGWLCLRDGRMTSGPAWWPPICGAALFAAALLFKENAATLLPVVALIEITHFRTADAAAAPSDPPHTSRRARLLRRSLRWYIPLLLVFGAYLAVRTAVLGGVGRTATQISPLDNILAQPTYGLQPADSLFLARWGTPLAVLAKAAGLLIWPHPLSWDYSYAAIDSVKRWTDVRLWLGLGVLMAAVGLLVASWRRQRWAFFAVGLSLLTYSVVSNIFIVIGALFAERYLYLPSAGFCLLVVLAIERSASLLALSPTATRRALAGTTILLCLIAAVAVHLRNRDFTSEATLNAADLLAQPRSARLWTCAAGDALFELRPTRTVGRAEHALEIYPQNPGAWRAAGIAHYRLNQPDAALAALQKSFEYGGEDSENAWVVLAAILQARGAHQEALAALDQFVHGHPTAATALNNLAWGLLSAEPATLRDPLRALGHAEQAIRLQPAAADFLDTYLSALVALGRGGEARRALEQALPKIAANEPLRSELVRKFGQP